MSISFFASKLNGRRGICLMQILRKFLRLLVLGTVAIAAVASAQDVPSTIEFADDPDAIRTGMGVYRLRCADCHGTDARGVRAPGLTELWASGRTDEGLSLIHI